MPAPIADPTGTTVSAEDIFVEGGPNIYFGQSLQYNPDDDGYYHSLVGAVDTPVYKLGCYENFRFQDNVSVNEIRCDNLGLVKTSQTRDYMVATFDLKSLFPLSTLTHILRGGTVAWNDAENAEKMGLGEIDNSVFWKFFFSQVYDEDAGDFVSVTGHRCQFTGNFQLQTPYSGAWTITGIEVRMYADDTKPAAQRFATVIRVDASAL